MVAAAMSSLDSVLLVMASTAERDIAAILSPGKPPTGVVGLGPIHLPGGKTRLQMSVSPEPLFADDGTPGFLVRVQGVEVPLRTRR